jgi:hypothetical protein
MHEFQHIITGDSAVGSIKQALGIEAGDIVCQSDDLSIGPLGDVDAAPSPVRWAFWREVFGADPDDGETDIRQLGVATKSFHNLPGDLRPCVVWFGTNANEQLTLRRTAHFLEGISRPLWAIEVLPEDQRPLPLHWCTGVSVLNPKELTAIFPRRRLVSDDEKHRLAAEWRALCAESSDATMRHFVDGRVETRPIDSYDQRIRDGAGTDWGNMARLVGDIMGQTEDAYVSDIFLAWRIYQLAEKGLLEIDQPGAPMRESRVRRIG